MIKAVIFDMDGVLINSQPTHYDADMMALKELGCPVNLEYVTNFAGTSTLNRFAAYKADLNYQGSVEEAAKRREEIMLYLFVNEGVEEVPGCRALIKDIKKSGLKMAIASSSSYELIYTVLRVLGVKDTFDCVMSGDDVKKSKPFPEIFITTASKLEEDPANCVVIEDSASGVLAAHAAGMKIVGYINPTSGEQDLSRANKIIDSYSKINAQMLKAL